MEDEQHHTRLFPSSLESGLHGMMNDDDDHELLWSNLRLDDLEVAYKLPAFPSSFPTVSSFILSELKVQAEIIRDDLNNKVCQLPNKPKPDDKHLTFPLPHLMCGEKILSIDFSQVHKVPSRGQFTKNVVLFQRLVESNGEKEHMEDLTLAFCNRLQKKDGVSFSLGADAAALSKLRLGETVYVRILKNFDLLRTQCRELICLYKVQNKLNASSVAKQLLEGRIDPMDMQTQERIDQLIQSELQANSAMYGVDLQKFNLQQQRGLALESLTKKGIVLLQGPAGTGKSHIICHGILPQAVSRQEKILVICNSNAAVDSLMLKCTNIPALSGRMIRCGFRGFVSEEIIKRGLFAEGDLQSHLVDSSGNRTGINSNTDDRAVQDQIRSKQVIFTTIHFASKIKGKSKDDSYWNFDVVLLGEAAQIEDASIFNVLARCPSLKRAILVGDPKQIQPYVPDSVRIQGYGKSSMERMMENCELLKSKSNSSAVPFIMLEIQHRMAPILRRCVSHLYYDGRLRDDNVVLQRGPADKVKLQPLLVVNLTGTKMDFNMLHQSYENLEEAMVVKVIYDFLLCSEFDGVLPEDVGELAAKDICILTPFSRHKDILRMCVCGIEEESLNCYSGQTIGNSSSPTKKPKTINGFQDDVPSNVATIAESIDTVDKFQGGDRKVVIISTCVDQKPLRAADNHFICSACSRAQHLLIVVGNFSEGLAVNNDWKHIWSEAKQNGSVIDHAVTCCDEQEFLSKDDQPPPNIHEDELRDKLRDLLERPSQRRR